MHRNEIEARTKHQIQKKTQPQNSPCSSYYSYYIRHRNLYSPTNPKIIYFILKPTLITLLNENPLFHRAEKEKAQYFGELVDLRGSVDHLANEKVHIIKHSLTEWKIRLFLRQFKSFYHQTSYIPIFLIFPQKLNT